MDDVASSLACRVQLSTDGLSWYLQAVEKAFGCRNVDYAQIVKTYSVVEDESKQRRYSPMACTCTHTHVVMGNPDSSKISTSYIERTNLSIRMGNHRMTRLTNGFSNKQRTTNTPLRFTRCTSVSVVRTRP